MPQDKKKHIYAGLALSLSVGLFLSPLLGLLTATIVGALKEIIWDWWWKRGTPEFMDFVATVAGGVIGCVLIGWL